MSVFLFSRNKSWIKWRENLKKIKCWSKFQWPAECSTDDGLAAWHSSFEKRGEKSKDKKSGYEMVRLQQQHPHHILPPVVEWRSSATMQMKDFLLLTEKNSWYVRLVFVYVLLSIAVWCCWISTAKTHVTCKQWPWRNRLKWWIPKNEGGYCR